MDCLKKLNNMRTTEKKKVLVLCQHFWPETFRINDICDYFLEKNCDVEVLCGIPNYPKGKFFEGYSIFKNRKQVHKGIEIRRAFEIPRGNNTNSRIFINYVSFPFSSLFHIPRLLTRDYDKIFIYQLSPVMMAVAGIILGKVRKIETTMYILDLWPENLYSVLKIKSPFLRKLIKNISDWHYRNVDKIITVSEKMKEQILERTSLPEKKVMALPQHCEKIYEKDIEDTLLEKRFETGFNIVFAGNISPAQDFETMIKAAKKLKSKGLRDINWIIVGDGMSRAWLEEEVKKQTLSNNFYFEGFKPVEDIPKYHTIADALIACLVKSDLLECTIPAKVMSYFAAGRPVLLAMNGEAQELVNKIGCGFACNSSDDSQLAENIERLYRLTKKERDSMGKRGRNYHFNNLERNIVLEKLFNFLNS